MHDKESLIKYLIFLFIIILSGCASTAVKTNDFRTEPKIELVNIYYHSLRKEDAYALGKSLKENGYLVNIEKAKPIFDKNKSYMFIKRENKDAAIALESISSKQLGHPLIVYFFKEKGEVGTSDILLTNVEASTPTFTSSIPNSKTPQLWSHHKTLNETPEVCAVKGVGILNSLGFKSVVKNGHYVYGNFSNNRAVIKCVNISKQTFVYAAVAGADVKLVEKLRNEISLML